MPVPSVPAVPPRHVARLPLHQAVGRVVVVSPRKLEASSAAVPSRPGRAVRAPSLRAALERYTVFRVAAGALRALHLKAARAAGPRPHARYARQASRSTVPDRLGVADLSCRRALAQRSLVMRIVEASAPTTSPKTKRPGSRVPVARHRPSLTELR